MKAKLFLLLLIGNSVSAQVVDVFSNLNSAGVSNLTNCDTYIYFNSYTQKKVYRFNHSVENPEYELVYTFNESPNFIYVNNNILYVGVESPYRTYKIDLLNPVIQPIQIANISGPMTVLDNNLYIGQYSAGKISKINLTNYQVTDVLVGYKPNFFAVKNNQIYFTSNYTNTLYKFNPINISLEVVLSNLDYVSGIVFYDNILYLNQSMSNSISTFTPPNTQLTNYIQLAPSSWPNGSTVVSNNLYFIQTSAGKISKSTLNNTLSSESFETNSKSKIVLYPNPAKEVVQLKSELELTDYKIYNNNGILVQNATLNSNEINISKLSSGVYTICFDGVSKTFIKE